MNRLLLSLWVLTASTTFSIALTGIQASVAIAHDEIQRGIQDINNALAYPTSSQQFFEEGQERLEIRIDQLQHQAQRVMPVLDISPDVFQQQQHWQDEGDRHLDELWHQRGDRVPPVTLTEPVR
jgi:hypothetical protein